MRRLVPLVAGAFAVVAVASACSDAGNAGPALPVTTAPPGTSAPPASSSNDGDSLPAYGAPKVEVPLDTTQFQQSPCSSLTSAQVTELLGSGVSGEPDPDAPPGPACNWHNSDTFASIGVIYTDIGSQGVSSLYGQKDTLGLFQPMAAIEGYPVVAYGSIDNRDGGTCQLAIGTSDRSAMDVSVTQSQQNRGKSDPCQAAHGVAEMVIGNILAAG